MTRIEPKGPAGAYVMRRDGARSAEAKSDRSAMQDARKTTSWLLAIEGGKAVGCAGDRSEGDGEWV